MTDEARQKEQQKKLNVRSEYHAATTTSFKVQAHKTTPKPTIPTLPPPLPPQTIRSEMELSIAGFTYNLSCIYTTSIHRKPDIGSTSTPREFSDHSSSQTFEVLQHTPRPRQSIKCNISGTWKKTCKMPKYSRHLCKEHKNGALRLERDAWSMVNDQGRHQTK